MKRCVELCCINLHNGDAETSHITPWITRQATPPKFRYLLKKYYLATDHNFSCFPNTNSRTALESSCPSLSSICCRNPEIYSTKFRELCRLLTVLVSILGAFAKLRKTTISFVMSVRLSVSPSAGNNSAPTGRIFMKFDIFVFFLNLLRKIKFY